MDYKKIENEEELRSIIGYPSEMVKRKVLNHLDEHCLNFISKAPFLTISTSDLSGYCDVSPRGDGAGFVQVLNEKQFVIPERPGNKRMDTLVNILSNPQVGLLFFIPGLGETLRVNGKASLVRDDALLEKLTANGRKPLVAIKVEVEECFIHCAKAFIRSQLWSPSSWLDKEHLPKGAKILASHAKLSTEEVSGALEESYTQRLY